MLEDYIAKYIAKQIAANNKNPYLVKQSTFPFFGKSKTFKKNLRKQIKLNKKRK